MSRGDPRHRLKAIRALVAGSPTKLRMTLQRAPPRGIPRRRCSVQSPGATPVRGSTPTPSTCRHRAQASSHWRTPAKAGRARRYRIEILPLWAPCAPAVSFFGGGVPGMNGWCRACAAGRALRRVTPCPTAPPAGIAASADGVAAVADAASDPRRGIVPTEVTGMALPCAAFVCGQLTCARTNPQRYVPREACRLVGSDATLVSRRKQWQRANSFIYLRPLPDTAKQWRRMSIRQNRSPEHRPGPRSTALLVARSDTGVGRPRRR